jgi:two-component system, LytTR family, sensor kinase
LIKNFRSYNPWIGFNDWPFILIGTPIVSVLVTMIFFGIGIQDAFMCSLTNLVPAYSSTLIFWLGDRYITIFFRKKFPAIKENRKRILLQSAAILIYTAIMAMPLKMSESLFDHQYTLGIAHPGYWKSMLACLFATVPISAIYEAGYFIHKWKLSIAESEKLKQQNTQSQLEALRNQINPHFLFNSLNTLVTIIPEDHKRAVDFVHKLSNVYRSLLDLKEKTIVTLEEELEYLDNYIYLLNTRFEENIIFDIELENACKTCYMVPLSLQMLVENAIKHNIISQKKPLHIKISNENDYTLVISNNLQLKTQKSEGTGTGLSNIENRYQLTFGLPIEVKSSDDSFVVKLPLIPINDYESPHH